MYGNVKSQNRKNLNCRHGQLQTLNVQTDTPDLIIPLMIPLIIRGMFCLLAAISHSLLAHYLMDNSIFAIPVYAHLGRSPKNPFTVRVLYSKRKLDHPFTVAAMMAPFPEVAGSSSGAQRVHNIER